MFHISLVMKTIMYLCVGVFCLICISRIWANSLSCDPEWFGPSCEFLCHCNDGTCNLNGQCPDSGDVCEDGWFGYHCQYRDLVYYEALVDAPNLNDNNPNTCTELKSVKIELMSPAKFTFLRLVSFNEEHVGLFKIFFKTENYESVKCVDMKNYTTDIISDIACKVSGLVREILIVLPENKTLCSIYVSGGRNIALKQRTLIDNSTYTESELRGGQFIVDGVKPNTSDISSNCPMPSERAIHSLSVVFNSPVVLYSLVVTSLKVHMNQTRGFTVDFFNEFQQIVVSYKDDVQKETGTNEISLNINSTALIKNLLVHFPDNPGKSMVICELEAFGDCGHPSYGLHCDDICSFHCLELRCHVTGECWKCDEGYGGPFCDKNLRAVTTPRGDTEGDDDGGGDGADMYVGNANINIILSILFGVFAVTIVMEVAGLLHLRQEQEKMVYETRNSLMQVPSELQYSYYDSDSANPTPVSAVDDPPDSPVAAIVPSTTTSYLNRSAISMEIARMLSSVTTETSDYVSAV